VVAERVCVEIDIADLLDCENGSRARSNGTPDPPLSFVLDHWLFLRTHALRQVVG
jgi:hypothetical protein